MDFVSFLEGKSCDYKNRSLKQIMEMSYTELEKSHDTIQVIFPLKDKSEKTPNSPVIDDVQIEAIKNSQLAKDNIVRSFVKMLDFFGMEISKELDEEGDAVFVVSKAANWNERRRNWLRRGDHNMLRMTRIIISLKLFGLDDYASAFFVQLRNIYEENKIEIGGLTYDYWCKAISGQKV